jgi:hypothetical protein
MRERHRKPYHRRQMQPPVPLSEMPGKPSHGLLRVAVQTGQFGAAARSEMHCGVLVVVAASIAERTAGVFKKPSHSGPP